MKNSNNTIGNRTRDLPGCSAVFFNRYVTFTSNYVLSCSLSKRHRYLTTSRVEVFSTSLGTLHWAVTYMTYKASVSVTYLLIYSMEQSPS